MVERLIFTADGVQFEEEFKPLHKRGYIIICDRFNRITDLVYGAAGGLNLQQVDALQTIALEHLMADFYFPFQLPLEAAQERKSAMNDQDRIEAQGRDFARSVAEQYNSLIAYHEADGKLTRGNIILQDYVNDRARRVIPVDATQSPKDIVKFIVSKLPLPEKSK